MQHIPAGITSGNIFLCHPQLRAAEDLLQLDSAGHHAVQIWIIKHIGAAKAFVGHNLKILPAKAVTLTCGVV